MKPPEIFLNTHSYILRSHLPGDMGWITYRHGKLYYEEYGWNEQFEALVAGIVSDFLTNYDAGKERCWIAEKDGSIIGSVFVVQQSEKVAKLRLLYVEPSARGIGLGKKLVQQSITFAKEKGYERVVLWTNSILTSARNIYGQLGFTMIEEETNQSFGKQLVSETWELKL